MLENIKLKYWIIKTWVNILHSTINEANDLW